MTQMPDDPSSPARETPRTTTTRPWLSRHSAICPAMKDLPLPKRCTGFLLNLLHAHTYRRAFYSRSLLSLVPRHARMNFSLMHSPFRKPNRQPAAIAESDRTPGSRTAPRFSAKRWHADGRVFPLPNSSMLSAAFVVSGMTQLGLSRQRGPSPRNPKPTVASQRAAATSATGAGGA
jgi:hypothetical protein